ncbi:MAG: acyl-CoA dehydrogenase family protein [Elusimicrobia bacterium]|nr:acyl-CoA dehydrogenase family protein [Elusimicrobiota bacterium]MDE2427064.1 acyl-CoA dehydrogenase family protein [Elusimicrobiota bacterium]
MDYDLTEQQNDIRDLAWQLAKQKIKPVREHYDQTEEYPWPIVEELRKADLFGVYVPEAYGGLGGNTLELVLVVEQLSRACGGIALSVAATGLGTIPIIFFGNAEQRKRWLPELASGKRLGAFALTEPGAGSDATATKCTAVLDGDHYVVNGQKNFCTNGNAADVYTFFATTNPKRGSRGLSAFVVEKGTPGFSFGKKEQKMGIRASWTYDLVFNNCRIPKANLLYKEGYGLFVAQGTFDLSRPGVASQALGIAQGALDETMDYVRVRKQFGQTIASFQAIQHMLADCGTQIEASRALLYCTAKALDKAVLPAVASAIEKNAVVFDEMNRLEVKRWTKESGMCKVMCSDTAMRVTTDCVQMCGGIGYMRDFPVEKYMRDAKITQIYEGTNQIQRNEIAMMMIKEAASKAREAAA